MISELCRFYQGEEKCPFEGDALKLWDIERIYFEALRDADKLSLAIAASFNAEVIDAIGRYYPSEKDELIARYNGSLREIIASVGSGWAEAEKEAQNRLFAVRGKIASMPRDAARSFLIDEIKDHSDFSDSLLGQSYENSGAWVTFDKPSWVLRETIEYHYWRIQDAMDRYFGQDQSDIIKDEVSRFLIHILMRDGLKEIYSEVIEGKKPKSPRVSAVHGEAAGWLGLIRSIIGMILFLLDIERTSLLRYIRLSMSRLKNQLKKYHSASAHRYLVEKQGVTQIIIAPHRKIIKHLLIIKEFLGGMRSVL